MVDLNGRKKWLVYAPILLVTPFFLKLANCCISEIVRAFFWVSEIDHVLDVSYFSFALHLHQMQK